MDIIKRINDLLAIKDWSIHQLSLECDVPRSTLYRIMAHEFSPTYEQIEKIVDGFGITIDEFFCVSLTPEADEVLLLKTYRELGKDAKKILFHMIQSMK